VHGRRFPLAAPFTRPAVLAFSPVVSAEDLIIAGRPVAQFQAFEHEFRTGLEMKGSFVHESDREITVNAVRNRRRARISNHKCDELLSVTCNYMQR
jgi:hypothetical protein